MSSVFLQPEEKPESWYDERDPEACEQPRMMLLRPGEIYFGRQDEVIRTLLGSCVAITLWHPQRRLGGMSHCLLPQAPTHRPEPVGGRYVDQAIGYFLQQITQHGCTPREFQAKLFGGGNMFPQLKRKGLDVGGRNVEMARHLLKQHGFRIQGEHVGLTGHRTIMLSLHTGETWLRWKDDPAAPPDE